MAQPSEYIGNLWAELTCDNCGKGFVAQDRSIWTWKDSLGGRTRYYCSYTCRNRGREKIQSGTAFECLRDIRQESGLRMVDMARELGISFQKYRYIELGYTAPSMEDRAHIARLLHVEPEKIFRK